MASVQKTITEIQAYFHIVKRTLWATASVRISIKKGYQILMCTLYQKQTEDEGAAGFGYDNTDPEVETSNLAYFIHAHMTAPAGMSPSGFGFGVPIQDVVSIFAKNDIQPDLGGIIKTSRHVYGMKSIARTSFVSHKNGEKILIKLEAVSSLLHGDRLETINGLAKPNVGPYSMRLVDVQFDKRGHIKHELTELATI